MRDKWGNCVLKDSGEVLGRIETNEVCVMEYSNDFRARGVLMPLSTTQRKTICSCTFCRPRLHNNYSQRAQRFASDKRQLIRIVVRLIYISNIPDDSDFLFYFLPFAWLSTSLLKKIKICQISPLLNITGVIRSIEICSSLFFSMLKTITSKCLRQFGVPWITKI